MGLLASDLEIGAFKAEVRMSYDGKVVNLELPGGEIIPPKFLIWAEAPEDRDMVKRLHTADSLSNSARYAEADAVTTLIWNVVVAICRAQEVGGVRV